jgi:hypothetical protein
MEQDGVRQALTQLLQLLPRCLLPRVERGTQASIPATMARNCSWIVGMA